MLTDLIIAKFISEILWDKQGVFDSRSATLITRYNIVVLLEFS